MPRTHDLITIKIHIKVMKTIPLEVQKSDTIRKLKTEFSETGGVSMETVSVEEQVADLQKAIKPAAKLSDLEMLQKTCRYVTQDHIDAVESALKVRHIMLNEEQKNFLITGIASLPDHEQNPQFYEVYTVAFARGILGRTILAEKAILNSVSCLDKSIGEFVNLIGSLRSLSREYRDTFVTALVSIANRDTSGPLLSKPTPYLKIHAPGEKPKQMAMSLEDVEGLSDDGEEEERAEDLEDEQTKKKRKRVSIMDKKIEKGLKEMNSNIIKDAKEEVNSKILKYVNSKLAWVNLDSDKIFRTFPELSYKLLLEVLKKFPDVKSEFLKEVGDKNTAFKKIRKAIEKAVKF